MLETFSCHLHKQLYDHLAAKNTLDVEEIRDRHRKRNEFHVCVEKQCAVKPCCAFGKKEMEPALTVVR